MSDASSPSESEDEGQVVRLARTAALLARRITSAVGGLTVASALSGSVLWGLLWWPVPLELSPLVGAALTLLVLLGPAVVLGLFYLGLHDLLSLPERVSDHASRTAQASTEAYRAAIAEAEGRFGWLRRLLLRIWSLRSLLLEHRALLLRYGAMLRMLTPAFLLLVLLAGAVSLLLLPLTVLAVLVAVLLG